MFAPIWNTRVLIGVGPRVADHTINLSRCRSTPPMRTCGSRTS